MVALVSGIALFVTRLMVGFGGFGTEPPSELLVLSCFGLSLSLHCSSLLIRGTFIPTVVDFGSTGNVTSCITHQDILSVCGTSWGRYHT